MFNSVLIANRGEIACRIARTAQRLGLRTIAVYSEPDAAAPHVRLCDEAHPIGPAAATQSYLDGAKLIAVARAAGAQCLHPGYGFLSERPDFAQACAEAGIAFVGPPPDAIRAMGLKGEAKALMEKAGVPVVPGYHGDKQDAKFLKEKAYQIGYPVLIKAVAGGGGKGMRRVDKHADFEAALEGAVREASRAFGDGKVLIEKYVAAPRHVEFQVFADRHGNVIHLGERDCSLQRRHQKVIEEAPAPGMTEAVRAAMGRAAVEAARAVGYVGAGTVEFIADGRSGLRADGFWFMEMNTRLQVEHPVTEAITGLDLVEWQFRIAAGEPLPLTQDQVRFDGHAIEARLYAEDPEHNFLPSTGRLIAFDLPTGDTIRVDAGVAAGGAVTADYDPMLAKLIAHGETRDQALDRLAKALAEARVAGPRTNIPFLTALANSQGFRQGGVDTGFIDAHLESLGAVPRPIDAQAAAAGVAWLLGHGSQHSPDATNSPWDATDGFQLSGTRTVTRPVTIDGTRHFARLGYSAAGVSITLDGAAPAGDAVPIAVGDMVYVLRGGRQTKVAFAEAAAADEGASGGSGAVLAPMHGKVLAVLVAEGDEVHKGQRLAVIEAMKMEHALLAPCDGTVAEIKAAVDGQVAEGARLMLVVPREDAAA